jgi:hypothetical protein
MRRERVAHYINARRSCMMVDDRVARPPERKRSGSGGDWNRTEHGRSERKIPCQLERRDRPVFPAGLSPASPPAIPFFSPTLCSLHSPGACHAYGSSSIGPTWCTAAIIHTTLLVCTSSWFTWIQSAVATTTGKCCISDGLH